MTSWTRVSRKIYKPRRVALQICGLTEVLSGNKAYSKLVITWDLGMKSIFESQFRNTRLNHLLTIMIQSGPSRLTKLLRFDKSPYKKMYWMDDNK